MEVTINPGAITQYISNVIKSLLSTGILVRQQRKFGDMNLYRENMILYREKIWLFLKELEEEMKNWVNGVEIEVPELIREAGYKA